MRRYLPSRREFLAFVLLAAALWGLWAWLPPQPRLVVALDGPARCNGLSPDGSAFVMLPLTPDKKGYRGPVQLWSLATGRKQAEFLKPTDLLEVGSFLSNGKLWIQKRDETDRFAFLDPETGREFASLSGRRPRLSPDGSLLAYSTHRNGKWTVQLIEVATGQNRGTYGEGEPSLFSPDGRILVTEPHPDDARSPKYEFKFWDVAGAREFLTQRVPKGNLSFRFSPDGKSVAIFANGHTPGSCRVRLVDVTAGVTRTELVGAFDEAFIADGQTLVTFFRDPIKGNCIKCLDTATGKETGTLTIGDGSRWPYFLQVSADGKTIAYSVDYDTRPGWSRRLAAWPAWLSRWGPKGSQCAVVKFLDVATDREVAAIPYRGSFQFSPAGKSFLSEGLDTVEVWDVPPRKPLGLFLAISAVVLAEAALLCWRIRRLSNEPRTAPDCR